MFNSLSLDQTVFCSGYQMYDTKETGVLSCKGFIGHVRPLQPPAIFEIPLVEGSFMTHHSLDMNYIFTDKRYGSVPNLAMVRIGKEIQVL